MIIGIGGGSGSGKTTVARHILDALRDRIVYLQQDHYYKDLSHLPLEKRELLNFDHPDAVDISMDAGPCSATARRAGHRVPGLRFHAALPAAGNLARGA